MNIDRFLATNGPVWDRFDALTKRAGHGADHLTAEETDELVSLYQRTSTHLSLARTNFHDPGLVMRLSQLVGAGHAVIYGTRPRTWKAVGRFFTETFPTALWRIWPFVVISAVLTFAPAIALGTWLANSSAARDAVAPAAVRAAYVQEESQNYYTENPSAAFATKVFTNNVQVAVLAFAAGILLCLPTAFLLFQNGVNLGAAVGFFAAVGKLPLLLGLLVPHGLIELTSVVIAGAAGLRLGWTIIDPGDRPRRQALAEEARSAMVLVFGVALTLAVAGTIEGFVTGSALPTWVRVGIGVTVEAVFLAWVWVCRPTARRSLSL